MNHTLIWLTKLVSVRGSPGTQLSSQKTPFSCQSEDTEDSLEMFTRTPGQWYGGQRVWFCLNHNLVSKITSLATEISLMWLLSQFSSGHSKNKLNENGWDCCHRVFSGKQTFPIWIVIKLSRETSMFPTLWMCVDNKKEKMVIKEWKQIKIKLISAFQTFLWVAFVIKCKVFPLPEKLVI